MKTIKKAILVIYLCLISMIGHSQESILNQFVGTWKWENTQSGDSFKIILKKGSLIITESFGGGTKECLIGTYKYKKNGTVIIDKVSELEKNYANAISYPIWVDEPINSTNTIYLTIKDYGKVNSLGDAKIIGSNGSCTLEYISSNVQQIHWKIEDVDVNWDELWTVDESQIFPSGTSLPTNIILTKVE